MPSSWALLRFPLVILLVAGGLVVSGRPASTQAPGAGPRITRYGRHQVAQGEVIVKYRDPRMATAIELDARSRSERHDLLNARGVARVRSGTRTTDELIRQLRADPLVEYVEPNYLLYALAVPNDPALPSLWALSNSGTNPVGGGGMAGADIDALGAWDVTTGSRSHVVGIVDTGIDYRHPDLAANVWSAPTAFQVTVGGQVITCAAGTHGFNAITRTCDPMDDNRHGTHVAGTVGAVGHNRTGITGVNWTASMMGLKFLGASGSGYTSDAVLAIEFAIQAKARFDPTGAANVRILSNSWGGGGYSQTLRDAIARANANDMLFVAAAGNSHTNNDASPHYPSSYAVSNVISVASSDSSDRLSPFSCYGANTVHLAAPGSAIYSTTPGNTYSTLQGTSMATPHVSGVAGLVLAACSATTAELKSAILASVDPVAAFAGITATGGRLNAARAVQSCEYPRIQSLALAPGVASPQPPGTTVLWTATASGGRAPYEYQWLVFNGTSWGTPTAWSGGNTFAWTPTVASMGYQVQVRARSAWNPGSAEKVATAAYVVMPVVRGLALTPNLASPRAVGTPVTWTAAATGGQAPYQYQWVLWNGTSWTILTGWTTNRYTWTPSAANAGYRIGVRARSAWNTGALEMSTWQAYAIMPKVTSTALVPSVASPQAPGTSITWTATPTGGQAPYQYQWLLWNGTVWTPMSAWNASNRWVWQPALANAAYQVQVRTRSAWNTGAAETTTTIGYAVRPVVTAIALAPARPSPQATGNPVTWTAAASGGQAPYQYQWLVHKDGVWTIMTGWLTTNTWTWTPIVANSRYTVAVRARSAGNTGTLERVVTQPYTIIPRITSVSLAADLVTPQASGTTVTFTAQAAGGVGPYCYKWTVYDGRAWTTPTAWSTSNQLPVTLSRPATSYQVVVYVMSASAGVSTTDPMASREAGRALAFATR